ncbi:MAG TPA: hypothetical protein VES65_04945 [Solirubrobacteraceae bacterium]|nr:hypothetical protein [Solirubrobacteraceae bacterium]
MDGKTRIERTAGASAGPFQDADTLRARLIAATVEVVAEAGVDSLA